MPPTFTMKAKVDLLRVCSIMYSAPDPLLYINIRLHINRHSKLGSQTCLRLLADLALVGLEPDPFPTTNGDKIWP